MTAYLTELVVATEHRRAASRGKMVAVIFHRSAVVRLDLFSTDTAEGFTKTLAHRRYAGLRLYPSATP
ncbi:MAG: hypothetical protein JO287_12070 [Pseudonocardiales bacterium]|nr:hypothetical protein [Pseudonocardiales bacterium]